MENATKYLLLNNTSIFTTKKIDVFINFFKDLIKD